LFKLIKDKFTDSIIVWIEGTGKAQRELGIAIGGLMCDVCKALYLQKILDWLVRKLFKEDK